MTRTARLALAFALALSLSHVARATEGWDLRVGPGGLHKAVAEGTATTLDGDVPAALRVQCRAGRDGSLCVGLKVEEQASPRFDYRAFEGPDAPARGQRLLSARVGAGDAAVGIDAAPEGHFADDPPTAFVFEVCAANHGASDAATLARAIAEGGAGVELVVRHPSEGGGEVRARFPADRPGGAVSRALQDCWRPDAGADR
jgi:hypothetical protein